MKTTVLFSVLTNQSYAHKCYVIIKNSVLKVLFLALFIIDYNIVLATLPAPTGFRAKGYEKHSYLIWNRIYDSQCKGYKLYISFDNSHFTLRKSFAATDTCYTDFILDKTIPTSVFYRLTAVDGTNAESVPSETVEVMLKTLSDSELLDMVQEATFRYFWDFAHPVSGLIRESTAHDPEICAIGATGFGLMAIIVGINRGYVSKTEGLQRLYKMVLSLEKAERFHGAWSHWLNGTTLKAMPFSQYDNGGDLVETAYLIQGLLTVRQYIKDTTTTLEKNLYQKITSLWESVEWDWYRQNNQDVLYWHWSPNYGWKMNMAIRGYNETLITYILAIASPTHSVPASLYHTGWASSGYKNIRNFYGIRLEVGPDYGGPLFWEHYSFLGFDPRDKKDAYTNYFRNNTAICLIDHAYCKTNPKKFQAYSDSCWGLTASFDRDGYAAHEPLNDNGTISPTAAISSFPYVPTQAMAALKYFYRNLNAKVWGNMGFYDAFNVSQNWYSNHYLGIDQGPIILMIENYRTALLWNLFMTNPEISVALEKIGFTNDTANFPIIIKVSADVPGKHLEIFPNPTSGKICIKNLDNASDAKFCLVSMLSKRIPPAHYSRNEDDFLIDFGQVAKGMYLLEIDSRYNKKAEKIIVY